MPTTVRLTRSTKASTPFQLFHLPPELRNAIYPYAFENSRTSIIRRHAPGHRCQYRFEHKSADTYTSGTGLPSLLLTNKQIRAEAPGNFYAATTWIMPVSDIWESVKPLLRKLGPHRRAMMTKLTYRIFSGDTRTSLTTEQLQVACQIAYDRTVAELEEFGVVLPEGGLSVEVEGPEWMMLWSG